MIITPLVAGTIGGFAFGIHPGHERDMRVLVSMFTDVAVTLGLQSTTKAWLGRRLDLDEASPSL